MFKLNKEYCCLFHQGADNCLEGLTFVITGVLESIERDEAKSLVERYGGKVTGSLSGRTSYIVIGRDAGETKLKKAMSLKTKQIDEDGLFDLIRIKPAKKSKYLINAEKAEKVFFFFIFLFYRIYTD